MRINNGVAWRGIFAAGSLLGVLLAAPPGARGASGDHHRKSGTGERIPVQQSVSRRTIQVGSLQLTRCPYAPAYCGVLVRPLDPAGQVQGTIGIGFEYYPRGDQSQAALGTIVATEGGPGYATAGSRAGYLGLFYPLLNRRNLLLMDN